MNMANTIVGSMAPRRRRGRHARRNPMKSGGKLLLGAAVVAAIGGAGYLLFVKKASAGQLPGGNAPAALQITPAGGITQTVSASKGQQIVVTMPSLPSGSSYTPTGAGGVSLTSSSGSAFTFTANSSGTITIGATVQTPLGNQSGPVLTVTVNV